MAKLQHSNALLAHLIIGAFDVYSYRCFAAIELRGGPNYNVALDDALRAYAAAHERLSNWQVECFEKIAAVSAQADGDKSSGLEYEIAPLEASTIAASCGEVHLVGGCARSPSAQEVKNIMSHDKRLLCSYGRPYPRALSAGASYGPAPRGYYAFARDVHKVISEEEWTRAV